MPANSIAPAFAWTRSSASLPPALGSADQIRQVLSNLVVNAKDSMNGGGSSARPHPPGHRKNDVKEMIRMLVADSGCGISANMLHTMFEPFVTTKGERGTGLGLVDRERHYRESWWQVARAQPGGEGNSVQH